MSLVFDKGKYKFYSEIDQLKLKDNNNYAIGQIKNNQKKFGNKNPQLYNEKSTTSPFRNINNNKKSTFLTTFQNNSNMKSNYIHNNNNIKNKKNINIKKLKYNKSFEGNFVNNDLIFTNNFDLNEDLYTIPHEGKYKANNKFNNSVILNNNKQNRTKNKKRNSNKSVTRTINSHINSKNKKNNFEENIIKKLDEKFKSLENNIIDKQYENDIDHDEMIISTNKKNQNNSKTSRTINKNEYKNNKLSNIIDDINSNKIFLFKDDMEEIFMNIFSNKNNIDFDEDYLLNTSFENNRNDFNIMYTNNYGDTVMDDLLSLEIKLLIEKMIEIQKSYHKELNLIISQYNKNNKIFKLLIEKIKSLQKKIYLIKKMKEIKNISGSIYNFIGIYNNNNHHEINKINKNEFALWGNIMESSNQKNYRYNKDKIRDLFIKSIFDKYNKISGKLNNIENKIILNLMKKFKYNTNKKNNLAKSNENLNSNKDKNKVFNPSPIQQYKDVIRQNKNPINNKKKHKKTSSVGQPKPVKYFKQK